MLGIGIVRFEYIEIVSWGYRLLRRSFDIVKLRLDVGSQPQSMLK
jgi:hypothetical protein